MAVEIFLMYVCYFLNIPGIFEQTGSIIIIETARKTPADHSRPWDTSAPQPRQRRLFLLYLPVFSYFRLCSSVCWESMYSLTFSMTVVPVVATK